MRIAYTDGSGNGYYGYQIDDNPPVIYHASGKITSNQAEFEALLALVRDLQSHDELTVYTDSQLLKNGFNQAWSLKNVKLKQLRDETLKLVQTKCISIRVEWVPRKQNVFGRYLDDYRTYDMNRTG